MIARLSRGLSCNQVAIGLGCAVSTVVQARRRYLEFGRPGLFDRRAGNGETKVTSAFREELRKVLQRTPQDFGWARTTWTRELLALEMERHQFPRVAVCTMGRALARLGARLGMPKAVVLCPWPERKRQRRIYELRWLAARATDSEPVFFSDELDLHLNPKIGRDWMLPGTRRVVITPGKNEKNYLAGALNAKTDKLTWVDDERKNSALFCKLLWRLVNEYKHARRIHIILDNYSIHDSQFTRRCLQQLSGRIVLHFLPPCCPDENDIERLWLDLHSNVTRNHRCRTMLQLLADVNHYLARRNQQATKVASGGCSAREAIRESRSVV